MSIVPLSGSGSRTGITSLGSASGSVRPIGRATGAAPIHLGDARALVCPPGKVNRRTTFTITTWGERRFSRSYVAELVNGGGIVSQLMFSAMQGKLPAAGLPPQVEATSGYNATLKSPNMRKLFTAGLAMVKRQRLAHQSALSGPASGNMSLLYPAVAALVPEGAATPFVHAAITGYRLFNVG